MNDLDLKTVVLKLAKNREMISKLANELSQTNKLLEKYIPMLELDIPHRDIQIIHIQKKINNILIGQVEDEGGHVE